MRITFISDTHNKHKQLSFLLPGGDLIVHAGDFSSLGYKHEIENIVSILGMVFSKDEFERIFKIKFEDLNISVNETSDIDRILEDNNNRYDIDEILDKISKGGISSLSPDEKKYLEDYSKNG
jgi:predicted phosphodiesterase